MSLAHWQYFIGHHPFQAILLAFVLGVIGDKLWYAAGSCLRAGSLKGLANLLTIKDILHILAALSALAAVGHTWMQTAATILTQACK